MIFFLATAPGLETVAAGEVGGRPAPGGVFLEGDLEHALRAQLRSRVGVQLSWRLAAGVPGDVRDLARSVDWAAVVRGPFRVDVRGGGRRPSQLGDPVIAAVRAAVPGAEPADGGPEIAVTLAAGELAIDAAMSGEPLHRRGWRLETAMAPLREDLAAGILRLAGHDGSAPLVDPMCGAGTIVIEGALLAMDRSPSLGRTFACEGWPCWPAGTSDRVRAELRSREHPPRSAIVARDVHAGALGVTRRNAGRAGVLAHLALERLDATLAAPPAGEPGLVVANLPYGRRVGEPRALRDLYARFAASLRERWRGWRLALLVEDPRLLPVPGARAIRLRNGGLPVTLLLRDRE